MSFIRCLACDYSIACTITYRRAGERSTHEPRTQPDVPQGVNAVPGYPSKFSRATGHRGAKSPAPECGEWRMTPRPETPRQGYAGVDERMSNSERPGFHQTYLVSGFSMIAGPKSFRTRAKSKRKPHPPTDRTLAAL